jgi:glucan 1,3-beta-glucosidase
MFKAFIYLLFSISVSSALHCNDGTVRGVNLGGWLLLEPWITPSIFEEVNVGENHLKIVDEYTYAQYVDPVFAKERLDRH